MRQHRAAAAVALALAAACAASAHASVDAPPPTDGKEPANAGTSIWTANVTGFRKEHGKEGTYTKRWDLSKMPHYVPKTRLKGTLRIWGNNYLKDGDLADYWEQAFAKYHPDLKIEWHLPTGAIAVQAIAAGVADLGMSYMPYLTDRLVFEQVFHKPLSEVAVLTGSVDVYGWAPAGIIVVNKDNPLTQISMKQLDGVFGGERLGGYVGSVWHTEKPYSRGPEDNIRTWGQLGLTGDWKDKRIRTGGQNLTAGAMVAFSNKVLRGSMQFAEGYQAYTNYMTPQGKINSWSLQVQRAVTRDKTAMFYASPITMGKDMKELALQGWDGGPYVKRSLETVRDHSYPLYNLGHFYYHQETGKPLDPKIDEFLRFVLSQEGQECIQREGRYLPLTDQMLADSLKTLK